MQAPRRSDEGVRTAALTALCGIALQGALEGAVLPQFVRKTGIEVAFRWGATKAFVGEILDGGRCDVAILATEAIEDLTRRGILSAHGQADVATAVLGIAVREGEPVPDVSSPKALVDTLLAARSVAYSQQGTSGLYFDALIDRLGIADKVRSAATIVPSGFTARMLVEGKADVAIQQISELKAVPGVTIVGPFPEPHSNTTTFRAAISAGADGDERALRLIGWITGSQARAAYAAAGLTTPAGAKSRWHPEAMREID